MMISMLINSLYNIIDSIYVARLGTEAVTALSIIFPLQNLTVAVSVGLGIGVNSIIARSMGAEKLEQAEKAASNGILLACFHYIIFCFLAFFLLEKYILIYTSFNTVIYQWSLDYGRIILFFSLPYLIFLIYEKLFQSIGWMKTAMIVMATGAIINIILDPIMIFGYFGLPALGVKGAAIATILGQTISCLLFFIIYQFTNFPIRIYLKYFKLFPEIVKGIYIVAIPAALTMALPSFLVALLNGILIQFSVIAVAVLGIYYKIQTFFYMPLSGLIQGMRPLISFNYGAKEYKRVVKTVYEAIMIGLVILALGTVLLQVFPEEIMNLFNPDHELLEQGVASLRIISLGFIFSVIPIISNGVFEALGLGKQSLTISLLRQLIIMIPAAYILSALIGVNGVWWSFPIAEFLAAIIAVYMLRKAFKALKFTY